MNQITIRLKPGEDLKKGIASLAKDHQIRAGCLLSAVGSLTAATLRMAGAKTNKEWNEPLEIVSGTGTVSMNGCHIHLSLADQDGKVVGGHLKEGCIIGTTAEIVVAVFNDLEHRRVFDPETGYDELVVA